MGRQTAELAEKSGLADRRGAALLAELEESRALLDSAGRGKKQADVELVAARSSVNDMTAINGKAAGLADELRAEQDHTAALDKGKAALNATMAELELNLGQADDVAAKGGRNAMAKLETRIRELEIELGSIQAKTGETFK